MLQFNPFPEIRLLKIYLILLAVLLNVSVLATEHYFFNSISESPIVYYEGGDAKLLVYAEEVSVTENEHHYTFVFKNLFLLDTENGRTIMMDSYKIPLDAARNFFLNGKRISLPKLAEFLLEGKSGR
jgi:hypothetical protein